MEDFFIFEALVGLGSGFLGAFISYEFIDKRRKQLLETYWHLQDEYQTDVQLEAKQCIKILSSDYRDAISSKVDEKFKAFYTKKYNESSREENQKIAFSIKNRLRFLNKVGLFLQKKMVDQDLIFDLIGPDLELDKDIIKSILAVHREEYRTEEFFKHFESLIHFYSQWKIKNARKEGKYKKRLKKAQKQQDSKEEVLTENMNRAFTK